MDRRDADFDPKGNVGGDAEHGDAMAWDLQWNRRRRSKGTPRPVARGSVLRDGGDAREGLGEGRLMQYITHWGNGSGDGAGLMTTPAGRRSRGFDLLAARLRSVVLLGGSVRRTRLIQATGRSVVDLPLTARQTILGGWVEQIGQLADELGIDSLSTRMLVGAKVPPPRSRQNHPRVSLVVEADSGDYRGTAGLLRDKTVDYDDDDLILVASAGQVLIEPLTDLALELADAGGEANLLTHENGVPSGLMLFTAASLRDVPEIGYQDFKEQALPKIAERSRVQVVTRSDACALPVRTSQGYIEALRSYHRLRQAFASPRAFEEDWRSTFSIVEPGVSIGADVLVHDSVVLRGAALESGSTLVRCVACPQSRLGAGARATDMLMEGHWRKARQPA